MIQEDTQKINYNVMISCLLAGCLEMYDFLLFGFFAPFIHANYLSFLTKEEGLIVTYILFAVGFLFRPLGSLIFGYIGDIYGRKRALVLSVSSMGAASLCMAILPPYAIAGSLSCWLIVIVRIAQGISVGGEYSGVTIYAIEHTSKKRMGIIGSIVVAGSALGVLLATIVSKIIQNPALPDYSWRFAFLLGFGLSIVGYFIRRHLSECPVFTNMTKTKDRLPLLYGLKYFKKEFLSSILLAGANNGNFYFILIFLPGFLKSQKESLVQFNTLILTSLMILLLPIVGWLSDRVGRLKILIFISLAFMLYQPILLPTLINSSHDASGLIHVIICAILLSSYVSTTNIFVLEIFPANCRFSCGALSYSIGTALFGGTAPFICSFIIDRYGPNPNYLAYYVSFLSFLGLIGALIMSKAKASHEIN